MGIEPTPEAWEAAVLPLNYARLSADSTIDSSSVGYATAERGFANLSTFVAWLYIRTVTLSGCHAPDATVAMDLAVETPTRCSVYRRRRAERTALYRAVQGHLETYLALARDGHDDGEGVPRYPTDPVGVPG
jgi:hypothetical protein